MIYVKIDETDYNEEFCYRGYDAKFYSSDEETIKNGCDEPEDLKQHQLLEDEYTRCIMTPGYDRDQFQWDHYRYYELEFIYAYLAKLGFTPISETFFYKP